MLCSDTQTTADITGGSSSANVEFEGIYTDTREEGKGKLFIALEGDSFDGHDFIQHAEDAGAKAIIAHKEITTNLPTIIVGNTEEAYRAIASWHRQSFSPIVIAITGSNGKTSTKNMLANILSTDAPTLCTQGNLNNHLGVPKTLLNIKKEHKYCVIEMGANHVDEISLLCHLAKPEFAMITNANNAHLGEFGSIDNLVKAKGEIIGALPTTGAAFINADSPHKSTWKKIADNRNCVLFGNNTTVFATNIIEQKDLLQFTLNCNNEVTEVTLHMIGKHQVENALAATACAAQLGINITDIKQGLEATNPEKGRLNLVHCNDFTVLDDSYNANPHSMKAAIDTLATHPDEKIAVLGSMVELGDKSSELHQEIGDYLRASSVDKIYTIGDDAKHYQGKQFDDIESLYQHLCKHHSGATILIKGSRMMQLDKLVNLFTKTTNSA
ncbi:MAG TPA: UDP-N-acetylmuramoyl-tripeptide--D-alanyl-D-alanine ligase [Candidatus Thioglobus sp.]|jgi:UDP-N-acetylmuramoyl-tripeptide--D-alanyl-D-alanine ligase|nr:UDP-N-acetylmuramoyl-tripeptide--D-alanyl-D-alanine ligase [Candidatus Thioglobus sp.]HIL21017.1 UDP-N-acetylmuramoyl-tripeptide--D-alanyl-D-alanine ligase [Candidatus Thioglobus sp.]